VNETIAFAKSNLLSLRRCFRSMSLIGAVVLAGWFLFLLRQSAPPMWTALLGCTIQVGAFVSATAFLCADRQRRIVERLPAAITLGMLVVLLHLALVAGTVWPSIEMIPFIVHTGSGAPLFVLLGIMPAAILASTAGYSLKHVPAGALFGLPMVLLVAGVGTLIQASAWATPFLRAVFDVAVGVAAGAGYYVAESKLKDLLP